MKARFHERGFSLLAALWFAAFFAVIVVGLSSVVAGSRNRLVAHKNRQAAAWMAISGVEYARTAVISHLHGVPARRVLDGDVGDPHPVENRWPGSYTSPDLGGGSFSIRVWRDEAGQWRVLSVGRAADVTQSIEEVIP